MKNTSITSNNYIRSALILVVLLAAIGFILMIDSRSNPNYTLSSMEISQEDFALLLSERALSEIALTTDLYIEDEELLYDIVDNAFYYSLVDGSDEGSCVLSLCNDDYSFMDILLDKGIHAAILELEEPMLVLYDDSRISYSTLVITTLPIMNISIDDATISELGLDETYAIADYTGASMSLYDNRADYDEKSRLKESDIKLHMRGGTTLDAPQKSYRLTLLNKKSKLDSNRKDSLLGMRKDDDWILYSAYSDYEKVRNAFSMNIWRAMSAGENEWSASVSNEYKYIELFFNNRYHGLYCLTYPVDNKSFNLTEGESLFKKKDWAGSEYSIDLEPYENEDGMVIDWLPGYLLEDGSVSDYSTLHELYYEMAYSGDCDDIRQCVDMENSIDLWLFYKITQAVDNVYDTGVKNLYVATKESALGYDGYKLLFAPWDMDQTWGNRYVDGEGSHGISSYYNGIDYDLPMNWSTVYFLQACGDATINDEVKARYAVLRGSCLSDAALSEMINEYEKDIYDSGAYERTMKRWPDANYYPAEQRLDDFEYYVLQRMLYIDSYIAGL